ncbi:hypothetical protein HRJ34_08775 [Rhizorhabdus wittichii]|uniref:Uncharacterized protein n=1 Tax=Rhizorhabdus wittichii TaxID=160791 RepID=A0A975D8A5_9SPHN|nr:hypothetical protein [Rhizorhabdus wittichii]QTH23575.1 hypothetical protein HRJ34_08775 [Rhizorhabdus wittichii]
MANYSLKYRTGRVEGLIPTRRALRVTKRLLLRGPDHDDPYPGWSPDQADIEAFCRSDETGFIRSRKAIRRAQRHLQHALAAGALQAAFLDGGDKCDIPTWAWSNDQSVSYAWSESRLPLDMLLPDPWPRWSAEPCYLKREPFARWLRSDLLNLPPPIDQPIEGMEKPPASVKHRPLPDRPYVDLAEALSWLAFGISLNAYGLWEALVAGNLLDSTAVAEAKLADAVESFADAVAAEKVRCIGKHVQNIVCGDDVLTEPIPPIRAIDYRQFDVPTNSLRYGRGLTTKVSPTKIEILDRSARRDMYRDVLVNRSDLIARFPKLAAKAERKSAPVLKRLPDAKLTQWLATLGTAADRLSQTALLAAARAAYPRNSISRDAVRKATAGRKSGPKPSAPTS